MDINLPEKDLELLIYAGSHMEGFEYWIRNYSQPYMKKWFERRGYLIFERDLVNYMINGFLKWKEASK